MKQNNTIDTFLALVRAGLWEKEVQIHPYGDVDFDGVLQLAEEQSTVGLVAAGIEHISDIKPQKKDVLQFIGQVTQLEQRNQAMNYFIGVMIDKMRLDNIYSLLVKGQGTAQCYARPLWRACGDVDFLLSEDNYKSAKSFLTPMAESVEPESGRHLGMTIGPWVVELHGDMHCGLSSRMDSVIDEVQKVIFYRGSVRSWFDGETQVFLPDANSDAFLLFTHCLKHFYKGGLGLRQICDWCRLLWTYWDSIDITLLEQRLRRSGLTSEWRAFGSFVVEYIGMPSETVPLYSPQIKWKRKAKRILKFIIMSGNFGHNRDSRYKQYPFIFKKFFAMTRRLRDLLNHATIFPLDSLRFLPRIMINGINAAAKGIG